MAAYGRIEVPASSSTRYLEKWSDLECPIYGFHIRCNFPRTKCTSPYLGTSCGIRISRVIIRRSTTMKPLLWLKQRCGWFTTIINRKSHPKVGGSTMFHPDRLTRGISVIRVTDESDDEIMARRCSGFPKARGLTMIIGEWIDSWAVCEWLRLTIDLWTTLGRVRGMVRLFYSCEDCAWWW